MVPCPIVYDIFVYSKLLTTRIEIKNRCLLIERISPAGKALTVIPPCRLPIGKVLRTTPALWSRGSVYIVVGEDASVLVSHYLLWYLCYYYLTLPEVYIAAICHRMVYREILL